MKLTGLSPEAHGTLQALRTLTEIRWFDREVARELVQHRYAELVQEEGEPARLRVTGEGRAMKPFETIGSKERPAKEIQYEAASIIGSLKAKEVDCLRLARMEQVRKKKENYLSLARHFRLVAEDISLRSMGQTPKPFRFVMGATPTPD